jgi:transcriptional regulator with XRE-family HTH domain
MINLVESEQMAPDASRPDPEEQAGRTLRRLRLAQGWSQEEVARRMQAYGYDFHQTMIAKIEAAQRPLRVRELADFAVLYGVEIQDLIHSPSGSREEVAREITDAETQLAAIRQRSANAADRRDKARSKLEAAQAELESCAREQAVLDERLAFLKQEAARFPQPETPAPKPKPTRALYMPGNRDFDRLFGTGRKSSH